MSDLPKAQKAAELIHKHCPGLGGSWMNDEALLFIDKLSLSIAAAPGSELFGGRHKEHVAYAIHVSSHTLALDPPAALASVFLATRFELYFRLIGLVLNPDGSWVSLAAKESAKNALPGEHLGGRRVNDVSLAYRLMLLNASHPVCQILLSLENQLRGSYPTDKSSPFFYSDLGSRIKALRDPGSHGFYSDLSSERFFYSLLVGIIFYGAA